MGFALYFLYLRLISYTMTLQYVLRTLGFADYSLWLAVVAFKPDTVVLKFIIFRNF